MRIVFGTFSLTKWLLFDIQKSLPIEKFLQGMQKPGVKGDTNTNT